MSAHNKPHWDRRADNEVLYGGDAMLSISDDGRAAVLLTSSIPSMPQRFVSLDVGDDGPCLRRSDGQDVRFTTDPLLAEMAAGIGFVRIEEVDLQGAGNFRRNEVYSVPVVMAAVPVAGPLEQHLSPALGM
ncbi:hypothetical protein BHAOGJBA_1264 [Methylobacterium hispanicum]|uniref:Uncharacterized protein n=1 Tax=Methylobacterium hispanicum TaxID=270350 RepID=A0AAV4ZI39_9HYPH|nr:hypothetical protein [Methylobacterium hispanicum]GJD87759.1 hypothetical protein BHAOGJBA_1264 [Methylobacterium hispanicum]